MKEFLKCFSPATAQSCDVFYSMAEINDWFIENAVTAPSDVVKQLEDNHFESIWENGLRLWPLKFL